MTYHNLYYDIVCRRCSADNGAHWVQLLVVSLCFLFLLILFTCGYDAHFVFFFFNSFYVYLVLFFHASIDLPVIRFAQTKQTLGSRQKPGLGRVRVFLTS